LRRQAEEQEQSLKSQEDELSSKKQELEGLKQEEAELEHQQKDSREQLESLTKNLQDTQLQISQVILKQVFTKYNLEVIIPLICSVLFMKCFMFILFTKNGVLWVVKPFGSCLKSPTA
jgi:hypothetical protein